MIAVTLTNFKTVSFKYGLTWTCPHCYADFHIKKFELEKKLEIAIKALEIYANLRYDGTVTGYETIAKEALKEIK